MILFFCLQIIEKFKKYDINTSQWSIFADYGSSLGKFSNPYNINIDSQDNIYVGDIVNGKISKIYFGALTQDRNTFKEIDLGSEVDKNDIYVSLEGKVYIIDNLKGSVKEMGSGKEYIFPGTYVQIYEGGILSLSDMKVTKTELK